MATRSVMSCTKALKPPPSSWAHDAHLDGHLVAVAVQGRELDALADQPESAQAGAIARESVPRSSLRCAAGMTVSARSGRARRPRPSRTASARAFHA